MGSVAGRHTDPRAVAGVSTTNASKALTGPSGAFNKADAGRPISGTGIPAAATIASVASSTSAQLSANATASGTVTVTIGVSATTAAGYGFVGWSPETETEAATYAAASGSTSPDRITDATTAVSQRNR